MDSLSKWNAKTPLQLAASGGHLEIARALIEAGANAILDGGGYSAFGLLSSNRPGSSEVRRMLIEAELNKAGRHIDSIETNGGESFLHIAAKLGDLPTTRFLIKRDAAVDRLNSLSCTPFQEAMSNGHEELASALVAAGAVDLRNSDGCTLKRLKR